MPTKNVELDPGRIYFGIAGGKMKYIVPEIPELELSGFAENTESTPIFISPNYVGEITGTIKTNWKVFLRLVLGKTNNWLKMHGYPMSRARFLK